MPGEYFDIVLFGGTVPIVEKKYVIKLPSDKRLHSQIYNGPMYSATTYNEDTTTYSWWIHDVPAMEEERYMPDDPDIYTKVVMATVGSWEEKSRWFSQVNKGQFEAHFHTGQSPHQGKVVEVAQVTDAEYLAGELAQPGAERHVEVLQNDLAHAVGVVPGREQYRRERR